MSEGIFTLELLFLLPGPQRASQKPQSPQGESRLVSGKGVGHVLAKYWIKSGVALTSPEGREGSREQ